MSKDSRQSEKSSVFVDCGRLDCRDLMAAKSFADNVQTARQRGIAEGAVALSGKRGSDCRNKRLLWIGQFGLRFGERCRDGTKGFTGAVHGRPPYSRVQSLPHQIWTVWPGYHGRSLPWRPRA